ncbi:hypothetical protein [Luteimicrobium subarcticum]|uniref:RES domain-containing protein n=1 Tax=Luteimicrobium subarcticum TaxID=620910 RepID=A0A2M8WS20_9MICO|nr:hypothetical protein [Luteimicrobium subarcticum]PJI93708.1 hypothetical protein CLV34_1182 [Luteimicrobium subarcticum]
MNRSVNETCSSPQFDGPAFLDLTPWGGPGQDAWAAYDARSWSRFDTAGGSTLYFSQTRRGAFSETIQDYRPTPGRQGAFERTAANLGMSADDLYEAVRDEWSEAAFMQIGHLPRAFRQARALFTVTINEDGWWIAPEHADSRYALAAQLDDPAQTLGHEHLDRHTILGHDRRFTTTLASMMRDAVLDDGTLPLGAAWQSDPGWDLSYAYWMRSRDDGLDDKPSDPTADSGQEISDLDPDLLEIAGKYRIKLH